MIPYIFKFLYRVPYGGSFLTRRYGLKMGYVYHCEISKMIDSKGNMLSFRFKAKKANSQVLQEIEK